VNAANTAEACIQSGGEDLVRAILRGVAVSCPQRIMRTLAVLLHGLMNHATYGPPARAAFQACMLKDEVLGDPPPPTSTPPTPSFPHAPMSTQAVSICSLLDTRLTALNMEAISQF